MTLVRRAPLVLCLITGVALGNGCSSSSSDASASGTTGGSSGTSNGANGANGGDTASDSAGAPGDTPPYANVTVVAASGSDENYTFNVTIESADIDCSQFSDWWEVLGEDGSLIYRRILDHSHTDANGESDPGAPGNTFTRGGGPVPVAAGDVVLVRAHMNDGGYNGQVMRGSVADGFAPAPDIDANFAAGVETEDPQPTDCQF